MSGRARWVGSLALTAAVISAATVVRLSPSLMLAVSLASPDAARWLDSLSATVAREEVSVPVGARSLAADLYRPAKPTGALVLVHGLSRDGGRQPDLERLAHLLAGRGQLVLVPHFEGMAAFRLGGTEVADVRAAVEYLRRLDPRVGVAGLSFGAGPVLLAAAELSDLRVVGVFGGYADLRNVIAFITTGVHTWAGQRHVQRQEEYNRWKLLSVLAPFVEDSRDRAALTAIAERRLDNPFADTGALETDLGREGQAMLALVLNRREEAVTALLGALPPRARQGLARLSALAAIPQVRGRLLIAHGAGDASIPFTESLRLAAAAPTEPRVLILRGFHHTGPQSAWSALAGGLGDAWGLVALLNDLLSQP
jgi:dienelactone hydrolase